MNLLLLLSFLCISFVFASDVVVLTNENFDQVVNGDKHVFLEFYAPWCGHCKNLAPVYEVFGTAFKKVSDVVVAKVDAEAEKELGSRFDIKGFPTLKYVEKGSTELKDYEKGRGEDDLVDFMNGLAKSNVKVYKPPTSVMALTPSSFDSIALDSGKHVMVEFFAPWCGHCKSLAPKYEKVANAFAGEDNVVVASVDADKYRDLGTKYGVSGFPTLKFFGANEDGPEDYSGGRTEEALMEFLNQKAGTFRTQDGGLTEEAGRIEEIDVIISNTGTVDDSTVDQVQQLVNNLKGDDLKHGNLYVKALKKVIAKGDSYVEKELLRLEGMIDSASVTPAKKKMFMLRKNILQAMQK